MRRLLSRVAGLSRIGASDLVRTIGLAVAWLFNASNLAIALDFASASILAGALHFPCASVLAGARLFASASIRSGARLFASASISSGARLLARTSLLACASFLACASLFVGAAPLENAPGLAAPSSSGSDAPALLLAAASPCRRRARCGLRPQRGACAAFGLVVVRSGLLTVPIP
jgi:hypothetical protein